MVMNIGELEEKINALEISKKESLPDSLLSELKMSKRELAMNKIKIESLERVVRELTTDMRKVGGMTERFKSFERLINLNPDIIFTSQDQTWPTPSHDAILNDEALKDITAVKHDLVIDVNADLVDRPGPRIVDGLEYISSYIVS